MINVKNNNGILLFCQGVLAFLFGNDLAFLEYDRCMRRQIKLYKVNTVKAFGRIFDVFNAIPTAVDIIIAGKCDRVICVMRNRNEYVRLRRFGMEVERKEEESAQRKTAVRRPREVYQMSDMCQDHRMSSTHQENRRTHRDRSHTVCRMWNVR